MENEDSLPIMGSLGWGSNSPFDELGAQDLGAQGLDFLDFDANDALAAPKEPSPKQKVKYDCTCHQIHLTYPCILTEREIKLVVKLVGERDNLHYSAVAEDYSESEGCHTHLFIGWKKDQVLRFYSANFFDIPRLDGAIHPHMVAAPYDFRYSR